MPPAPSPASAALFLPRPGRRWLVSSHAAPGAAARHRIGHYRPALPHLRERAAYGCARDQAAPSGEGGAERFLDFIERELKPLVGSLAPLDPARQVLFGHSYGGLCTSYALFTRPGMFQTYLASSPSIWYRERVVLAHAAGLAKRVAALPVKPALMLAKGEIEQPRARRRTAHGQAGDRGAAPPG